MVASYVPDLYTSIWSHNWQPKKAPSHFPDLYTSIQERDLGLEKRAVGGEKVVVSCALDLYTSIQSHNRNP